MRHFAFCDCMARAPERAMSAKSPASGGPADPALLADLVVANHILADHGIVDGFGHVSVRHGADSKRFLLSRSMAPALVTAADVMEFDLAGTAVDPQGRSPYLERFIHGEIYRRRPDVMSVVHSHSPGVIPFSISETKLRPVFHMSGFLPPEGAPVFEIRNAGGPATDMLISNPGLGVALAEALGDGPVILMRGHGSTTVGGSIRDAVFRAIYTDVNAKLQGEAMRLGGVTYLNADEARLTAATNARVVDRPWELWRTKASAAP